MFHIKNCDAVIIGAYKQILIISEDIYGNIIIIFHDRNALFGMKELLLEKAYFQNLV